MCTVYNIISINMYRNFDVVQQSVNFFTQINEQEFGTKILSIFHHFQSVKYFLVLKVSIEIDWVSYKTSWMVLERMLIISYQQFNQENSAYRWICSPCPMSKKGNEYNVSSDRSFSQDPITERWKLDCAHLQYRTLISNRPYFMWIGHDATP